MNFRDQYKGREILHVRHRPQIHLVFCALYTSREILILQPSNKKIIYATTNAICNIPLAENDTIYVLDV